MNNEDEIVSSAISAIIALLVGLVKWAYIVYTIERILAHFGI